MRTRRFFVVLIAFLIAGQAGAQSTSSATGRVIGRIIDGDGGAGLIAASITVPGTQIGVLSGVDGFYLLTAVPAGTFSIEVKRIGYQTKTITGVVVTAGATAQQNVTLASAVLEIEAISVSASAERGSVAAALDKERTATGVVSSITAEQMARSPDRDAAQAIQRVSGVTVQDNKYVLVRGLGERYTTTSLNGARLPSPEPERKVVPLDLFPASLLESITTSKTFTPDQPGDFSGASVDIQTREFPNGRSATFYTSAGLNALAMSHEILAAPRGGTEWFGFAGKTRAIPQPIVAAGRIDGVMTPEDEARLAGSFRDVWSPNTRNGTPSGTLGFTLGGDAPIEGHPLGYVLSGSYGMTQEVRADETRATAVPNGEDHTRVFNAFNGSTGRTSVLWGGIFNLSTVLGSTRLSLANMYDRTADNEAHQDFGHYENLNADIQRTTLLFVERSVRSSQLHAQHVIGTRSSIDWSVTTSGVMRNEPDRSDMVYIREVGLHGEQLPLAWLSSSDDGAKRGFATLDENEINANINYKLTSHGDAGGWAIKTGAAFRRTHRVADARSYSIFGLGLSQAERELPPEQIFDGRYDGKGVLSVENNSAGGSYTARDRVAAAYGMVEYPLTSTIRLVAGARIEDWRLSLESAPIFDVPGVATPHNVDVLPSLTLNIKVTDDQNLRLAATRTLSRPEYRELSPITFRDVIGEQTMTGNPSLERTLVDNFDARWELYPSAGQVVSVALFAKQFHNPIERVDIATSGSSQLGYVNADGATNYGVELEMRKDLQGLTDILRNFALFTNATIMQSRIKPGNDSISSLTNSARPMVGQSPYVMNGGLTFSHETYSATLLYNVFGKRITAAGSIPLPDTYEMPRNVLDFASQVPVGSRVTLKLNAKNLLNAAYEQKQGDVTRLFYRAGRVFSLGVGWKM